MTLTEPRSCEPPFDRNETRQDSSVRAVPPPAPSPYTISEVAVRSGLSVHTLRWYERIGLMPHIDRSPTGQRRFSERDLDWIEFVGKLRMTGMPVADMVRYAEMVRMGDHTLAARLELLSGTRRDVQRKMDQLHEALAALDYKIDLYSDACVASERE